MNIYNFDIQPTLDLNSIQYLLNKDEKIACFVNSYPPKYICNFIISILVCLLLYCGFKGVGNLHNIFPLSITEIIYFAISIIVILMVNIYYYKISLKNKNRKIILTNQRVIILENMDKICFEYSDIKTLRFNNNEIHFIVKGDLLELDKEYFYNAYDGNEFYEQFKFVVKNNKKIKYDKMKDSASMEYIVLIGLLYVMLIIISTNIYNTYGNISI